MSAYCAETVEVLGKIIVSHTYAYEKPSFKSKALGRLVNGAKVLIVAKDDDWLQVRLFNHKKAFVYAKYVSLKVENISRMESESKVLIDINNLLEQFNDAVESSWYAEKQKVVPSLKLIYGKRPDDITLLYSAVNAKGSPVPSLRDNPLQKSMVKLVELIFMKMIVLKYDRYKIDIVVPDFVSGAYRGRTEGYITMTLRKNYANLEEIKNGSGSIWDYVRSAKSPEEMFKDYPH